ncbi:MAG: DUF5063 domain-containing protein [Phycisphaeraceae bacterium]|nr:DUF5063 domain-containing protein [Phycisphaeraceae bacterium]
MGMSDDNLKYAPAFAEAAADYCRLIDELCKGRLKDQYRLLETALARLHLAVLPLRWADCVKHTEQVHVACDFRAVLQALGQTLGEDLRAIYQSHMSDEPDAEDKCSADRAFILDDDLAEIYEELHRGLAHWQSGTSLGQSNAVWEWRWCFDQHWGEHLFRAMTTIHELRYDLIKD